MTRRLWIAVGVVAFLVVIVFVGHVLLSVKAPLWSINRERFDRVEEGMTRDDVELTPEYLAWCERVLQRPQGAPEPEDDCPSAKYVWIGMLLIVVLIICSL